RLLLVFNRPPSPELSSLALHDALPISTPVVMSWDRFNLPMLQRIKPGMPRSMPCLEISNASRSITPSYRGRHLPIRKSRGLDYRSEEHTSELQSRENLVCRLLLEKKNT